MKITPILERKNLLKEGKVFEVKHLKQPDKPQDNSRLPQIAS